MPGQTDPQGSDFKEFDWSGNRGGDIGLFDPERFAGAGLEFAQAENAVIHKPALYNVDELVIAARISG